jgi:hypothetical protein
MYPSFLYILLVQLHATCNALNGILIDSDIGNTQLILPNAVPHVVNVTFGLPNRDSSCAVTMSDGTAYFIGGGTGGPASNIVKRYNPATNTSTNAALLNTARQLFGCTVVNNTIVVCGGTRKLICVI